jgi:hypothetical protein
VFGLAWLTLVTFQVVRDVKVQHRAPLPSEFVASSAFFVILALIAGGSDDRARVATVLAWGIVIAIVLQAGGPANLINNGAGQPLGKFLTPGGAGAGVGQSSTKGNQGGKQNG